ncbi:MAG: YdbH domain-containing protein [Deltaproteobacteria bacterium]|nr:YdbH domain-containing protein [Deltaproteobacteria bacterium]
MMVGDGGERSKQRTLRRIAAIAIVFLAALVATAITYRLSIAEILLMRQLRNLGLDEATFTARRFDAALLEIENFSIGSGDGLEIAKIEAHFSTRGLIASRLDALRISGVRLRGTLDETGLSFGALDPLLEENAASANSSGPVAIPASGIEIEDALLEIATADGPIHASLDLQVDEIARGELEAQAKLRIEHEFASVDARLIATGSPSSLTGKLEFEAHAAGELRANVSSGEARMAVKSAFSFEDGDIAIRPEGCAEIHIDGRSVEEDPTPSQPFDLCLHFQSESGFHISKEGEIEMALEFAPAEFAADLRIGGEPLLVSGVLPALRMRASRRDDEFEASLEIEGGQLEFPKQAVGVRDIKFEGAVVANDTIAPNGHLRIEEIFDTQQAARFPTLALDARFELRDGSIDFENEFANPNRELVIEIDGTHGLSNSTGQAGLRLHAIDFDPGQLQPATLFPFLSDLLTEASGSVDLLGSIGWNADGMHGKAEVGVRDISATAALATFAHMNGVIELDATGATLPNQTIWIDRVNFGLELTDGLIQIRMESLEITTIESASWKFAGGELTTTGEFDPRSENWETSLLIKNVDLAQLLELVDLEGLSGSGTLEGELPIAVAGNEIEIRGAVLGSSGEAGVIRFRPDAGTARIAAADEQFATTLSVLENFHYDRIVLEINGPALGEVEIRIRLVGRNPDHEDGYPVDFTLSVKSRLSDLLQSEMRVYQIPLEIEKRLRAYAERAR